MIVSVRSQNTRLKWAVVIDHKSHQVRGVSAVLVRVVEILSNVKIIWVKWSGKSRDIEHSPRRSVRIERNAHVQRPQGRG